MFMRNLWDMKSVFHYKAIPISLKFVFFKQTSVKGICDSLQQKVP